MNIYETEEYNGFIIKIAQDEDPTDPREFDCMGEMTCFHNRYNLGDRGEKSNEKYSVDQLNEIVGGEDVISLPLYLLDHSGLRMKVGSFNDPWDSGQVGYIWMYKSAAIKEFGKKLCTKKVRERAIECMKTEVELYDKYLSGGFVGYIVEDNGGDHLDSCWGFDDIDYCRKSAKDSVDCMIKSGKEADKLMAL